MSSRLLQQYLEFYRHLGITELFIDGPGLIAADTGPPAKGPQPAERPEATSAGDSGAALGPSTADPVTPAEPAVSPAAALRVIQEDIGDCTRCRLHAGRKTIVFGSGNPNAKVVFVGEGPGADEDIQGLPFVGRAGQKLTAMINGTCKALGLPLQRGDVYICNVVKCRPPRNRAPKPDEMEICGQFVARQIEAIGPRAICVLGATAAKALLKPKVGITKLRGTWQEWAGIPVMPTYHPSYVLRRYTKEVRTQVFEDLKKVFLRAYR